MGHPTRSSEQIRQRNEDILAYAEQHPEMNNNHLGAMYGLNRETIRLILTRGRRRLKRNEDLAAKAREWGLAGRI